MKRPWPIPTAELIAEALSDRRSVFAQRKLARDRLLTKAKVEFAA